MHRYTHIQFCSTAFCSMTFLGWAMLQKTALYRLDCLHAVQQRHSTERNSLTLSSSTTWVLDQGMPPHPLLPDLFSSATIWVLNESIPPHPTLQCKSNFNQQHKITNNIYWDYLSTLENPFLRHLQNVVRNPRHFFITTFRTRTERFRNSCIPYCVSNFLC